MTIRLTILGRPITKKQGVTMKEITLTKGAVALVDDSDFERINQHKWQLSTKGYAVKYAPRINGKRQCKGWMHREVIGAAPGFDVDHIDGNKLNNQSSNLRQVTRSQNIANAKRHRDGSSRFKGVTRHQGKWMTRICVDYKSVYIGTYDSESEAALAYNKFAIKYFGEFARLNQVGTTNEN